MHVRQSFMLAPIHKTSVPTQPRHHGAAGGARTRDAARRERHQLRAGRLRRRLRRRGRAGADLYLSHRPHFACLLRRPQRLHAGLDSIASAFQSVLGSRSPSHKVGSARPAQICACQPVSRCQRHTCSRFHCHHRHTPSRRSGRTSAASPRLWSCTSSRGRTWRQPECRSADWNSSLVIVTVHLRPIRPRHEP